MATSCRISGQLRGWDLGFYSTCCFVASSYSALKLSDNRCQRARFSSTVAALHVGSSPVKSSGEAPVISDCFSLQQGDDPELPPEGSESVSGGVVALGKFDALHIGHRELAIQASKIGIPFLLSFVGMAEVLGWEPRDPIVAKCDRKRVLSSWAPYCGNMFPNEFCLKFSSVRHLTPQQFVEKLSRDLGVRGVVAGENYRFGYKAAGDASELVRLCDENGIEAFIVPSVMDKNQLPGVQSSNNAKERGQVSSTRVRQALAVGDMKYVSELLGRKHRVMLALTEGGFNIYGSKISILRSCSLNLLPKEGLYQYCSCFISNTALEGPCKVVVESKYIHVERHDAGDWAHAPFHDCRLIGIEFDDSREIC